MQSPREESGELTSYFNLVIKLLALWNNSSLSTALAATATPGNTNQLQTETVRAWEEYIRGADSRMTARIDGHTSFLWTDESAERRQRIGRGEIIVAPVLSHGNQKVPHGLIHPWIGGVFITGATIDSLSAVMLDYAAYKDFYKPLSSIRSRWRARPRMKCSGWYGSTRFYSSPPLRVSTIASRPDRFRRGYNVADSLQLQEIENYKGAAERVLPPGTGNGYIWRLHSIARYEQREGGVNLEVEAMALTRDIPTSVRWLVNPIVNRLSMNSLVTTLQQTRDATKSAPVYRDRIHDLQIVSRSDEANRPLCNQPGHILAVNDGYHPVLTG